MHIAIDETADFVEAGNNNYGIVTLVTITDKAWDQFCERLSQVLPDWKNTKSSIIPNSIRKKIIKELTLRNEVHYFSYVYDIGESANDFVEQHKTEQARRIDLAINDCKAFGSPQSLIDDLVLLKNQLRRYSVSDYAKFILIFDLIVEWNKYHLFDLVHLPAHRDSWSFHLVIDTQNKPQKFERLISAMMILTTSERNPDYHSYIPTEWSSLAKQHPYIEKYAISDTNDLQESSSIKIDAKKVYPNVVVSSEQTNPQLFLPDFIGNMIHRSISDAGKISENHKLLAKLRSSRSLGMNNKDRRSRNNYYIIRTFNADLQPDGYSPIFTKHYNQMKHL